MLGVSLLLKRDQHNERYSYAESMSLCPNYTISYKTVVRVNYWREAGDHISIKKSRIRAEILWGYFIGNNYFNS